MNCKALFLSVMVATSLLTGCNSASKPKVAQVAPKTASYVCPMGCKGSENTKPGTCPVCEMTLEKKS